MRSSRFFVLPQCHHDGCSGQSFGLCSVPAQRLDGRASGRKPDAGKVTAVITDFLIDMWVNFCNWFASLLPTTSPFDVAQSGASWGMFSAMDFYLPVHELMSVFAAVFLLGGPMMLVTLVIWVAVGVIRGGATRA